MDIRFLKSSNRFFYLWNALIYRRSPQNIFDVAHSDGYLPNSDDRDIWEKFHRHLSRKYK